MAKNTDSLDQGYALLQESLDEVVNDWRASLGRKAERHGEKFDPAAAFTDLLSRMAHSSPRMVITMAAAAVDRLAKMADYSPVPDTLAGLDFDIPDWDEDTDWGAPDGGPEEGES
jgi:hypothetical protein